MSNIQIGQLVRSRAGRDRDRWFVVVGLCDDDRYVQVADGRIRRTHRPKKKNLRHLDVGEIVVADIAAEVAAGRPVSDSTIREIISRVTSASEGGSTVDSEPEEGGTANGQRGCN